MDQKQIIYKMEQFEGPLDLLLSLISKNKMSIEDIRISIICDQYMEYINTMQSLDIELSAEFLVMASHLMLIKSRILLPRVDENNPDEDLAELQRMLLEHKRAKDASVKLGGLYSIYNGRMEKDTDEISPDRTYVAEHTVDLLSAALMRVMSAVEVTSEEAAEKIKPLISTRTISVSERVFAIMRMLLNNDCRLNLIECFKGVTTKHEAVATFMAILEMLKAGRITLNEDTVPDSSNGVIDIYENVYVTLFTGKIRQSEENNG